MELIVISESKIKIMLTEPDMQYYRLNASNMNCADVCTQAAFRHIFEDAHREVGFDTEGKRLFIQLYTSIEGGCEIFVTKLDKNTQSEEDVRLPEGITADNCGKSRDVLAVYTEKLSEGEKELLEHIFGEQRDEIHLADQQPVMFQFPDLKALLRSCHRLLRAGYRDRSTMYVVDTPQGSVWYLSIFIEDKLSGYLPPKVAFLSEYGIRVHEKHTTMYLSEYGRCICRNDAVQILGSL